MSRFLKVRIRRYYGCKANVKTFAYDAIIRPEYGVYNQLLRTKFLVIKVLNNATLVECCTYRKCEAIEAVYGEVIDD